MPKVGVVLSTSTTEVANVIADLGTRCDAAYAPGREVLPEGDAARNLESAASESPGGLDAFARSRERFEGIVEWLGGEQADRLEHAELEDRLQAEGRELLRRCLRIGWRCARSVRSAWMRWWTRPVSRGGGVEAGHERALATIFGEVPVSTLAYRRRGKENLYGECRRNRVSVAERASHAHENTEQSGRIC